MRIGTRQIRSDGGSLDGSINEEIVNVWAAFSSSIGQLRWVGIGGGGGKSVTNWRFNSSLVPEKKNESILQSL